MPSYKKFGRGGKRPNYADAYEYGVLVGDDGTWFWTKAFTDSI